MGKYIFKFVMIILIVIFFTSCIVCCAASDPMTEEERAALEASRIHEYKVISVYQYIETQTNKMGGVISQKLSYCFTYIGDDGQLHQFEGFQHTDYGLWQVCIGDENKYVVKDGFDTYRWLYLTEETLANIQSK